MVSSLGTRMHASLVLMYIGRATFKITDYFVLVHVLRCCLPVETTSHGLICIMIVDSRGIQQMEIVCRGDSRW